MAELNRQCLLCDEVVKKGLWLKQPLTYGRQRPFWMAGMLGGLITSLTVITIALTDRQPIFDRIAFPLLVGMLLLIVWSVWFLWWFFPRNIVGQTIFCARDQEGRVHCHFYDSSLAINRFPEVFGYDRFGQFFHLASDGIILQLRSGGWFRKYRVHSKGGSYRKIVYCWTGQDLIFEDGFGGVMSGFSLDKQETFDILRSLSLAPVFSSNVPALDAVISSLDGIRDCLRNKLI